MSPYLQFAWGRTSNGQLSLCDISSWEEVRFDRAQQQQWQQIEIG